MLEFRRQALDGATLPRRVYWRALRPLRQVWLHRDLTDADVTIASYPRSGNLWLRVLVLNALLGRASDFNEVTELVPHLGRHYSTRALLPGGGRLIKSHEPYRAAYRRAVYVVRDPRDVAVSYFKHLQRRGSLVVADGAESEAFDQFLDAFLMGRHEPHGRWSEHVGSWLDAADANGPEIFLVRYEDMRDDPRGHLRRLASWIGVDLDDEAIERVLERASIDQMRRLTSAFDERSNKRQGREMSAFNLVGSGSVGGWRDTLSAEQARRFAEFNSELARVGYETA